MAAAAGAAPPDAWLAVVSLVKLDEATGRLKVGEEGLRAIAALPPDAKVVVLAILGKLHAGKSTTMNAAARAAMGEPLPADLSTLVTPFKVTGKAARTTHGIDMVVLRLPEASETGITHVILLDVEGLERDNEDQQHGNLLAVAADALSTTLGFQMPSTLAPAEVNAFLAPIVAARSGLRGDRGHDAEPDKDLLLLSRGKPYQDYPKAENLTRNGGAPIGVAGMYRRVEACFLAPTRFAPEAASEALQAACASALHLALDRTAPAIDKDALSARLSSLASVFDGTMEVADFGKTLVKNLVTSVVTAKLVWQDPVDTEIPIDERFAVLKGLDSYCDAPPRTEERSTAIDAWRTAQALVASDPSMMLHPKLLSEDELLKLTTPEGATLARIQDTRKECADLLACGGEASNKVFFMRVWHDNLLAALRRGDATVAGTSAWCGRKAVVGTPATVQECMARDPRSFIAADPKVCKPAEALLDPALALAAVAGATSGDAAAGAALPTALGDIDKLVLANMLRSQALDAVISTCRPDAILTVASNVSKYWKHYYGHMLPEELGSAPPFKMWVDSDRSGTWASCLRVAAARMLNCQPDRSPGLFPWARDLDVQTLVADGLVGGSETDAALAEAGVRMPCEDPATRNLATALCALRNLGMNADAEPSVGGEVRPHDVMPLSLLAAATRGKDAVSLLQVILGCNPLSERMARTVVLQARPDVGADDKCGAWERSTLARGLICAEVSPRTPATEPGLRSNALNAGAHLGHALAAKGECVLDFETLGMPPRADPSKPKATGPTKADVSDAALTARIIRNSLATQRDSCGLLPATVAAVHGHAETTRRLLDWKPDLRDLEPVAWADRDAIDVATLAAASPDELIAAKASLRRVDWAAPLFDMPGPGERKAHLLLHVEAKAEAPDDVVAALMRILPQHVLTLPGPSGETAIELALRDEEFAPKLVGRLLARGVQFETRAQAEMAERISAIPDAACAAVDRFRPAASRGGLTELHYLCRSGLGEPIARLCAAAPQRAALATRDGRMPAQLWQPPRATAGAAPAGDDEAGEDDSPADDDPPCEAAPSTEHAPAAGEPASAPPATRPRPGAPRLPPACLNPATALVAALEHACATNPDSMTTAFAEDAEQHARCLKGLEQLVASPRLAGFVEAARMDMEHAWDGRSAEQRDFLRRCLGPTFAGGHAIGSSDGRMARQQLWRELLHPTSRRLDETDGLPLTPMAAEALVRSEWRAQLQPPLADTALSAWAPEDGLAMELTPVAVEILSTAAKQANWTRDTMASMPPRLLSARKLTLLGAVDAAMLPGLARALPGVTHLRYHGATSDGILRLAEALADWRCVEVLELQGAKYDVAAMEAFGPALRELPRLRALRIGGNDPEDSSPTTKLIDCLGGLSSLQQLNLAGRRISNRGAKTLAAALGGMEQLRSLVLSGCAIAKRGIQDIAVALRGRRITTLVLSGNSITDGAAAELAVVSLVKLDEATGRLKVGEEGLRAIAALPPDAKVVVLAILGKLHAGKSTTMNAAARVAMGEPLPADLSTLVTPFKVTGKASRTTHGIDMVVLRLPEASETGITHVILLDVEGLERDNEDQQHGNLLAVAADALSTTLGFQMPSTLAPAEVKFFLAPIVDARSGLRGDRGHDAEPDKDLLLLSRGKPYQDYPKAENLTRDGGAPIGVAGMYRRVEACFLAPTGFAPEAASEALQAACASALRLALDRTAPAIDKDALSARLSSLASVFDGTMEVADFGKTLVKNLVTSVVTAKLVWQDPVDTEIPIDERFAVPKGLDSYCDAPPRTEERSTAIDAWRTAQALVASDPSLMLHPKLLSEDEILKLTTPEGATLARIQDTRKECADLLACSGEASNKVFFMRVWHDNLLAALRRGDATVAGTSAWCGRKAVVGTPATVQECMVRDPRSFIAADPKVCKPAEALLDPALALAAVAGATSGDAAAGAALPTALGDIDKLVLANMLRSQALDAVISTCRPDAILTVASNVSKYWKHYYGHMLPEELGSAPPFKMWVDSDRSGTWASCLRVAAARMLNCQPDRSPGLFPWARDLDVQTLVADGLVGGSETDAALAEAGVRMPCEDPATRNLATALCALRNLGMNADAEPSVGGEVRPHDVMPLSLLAAATRGKDAVSLLQVILGCNPLSERMARTVVLQARPEVGDDDKCGAWERSTLARGFICAEVSPRTPATKPGLRSNALNAGAHLGHALAAKGECVLDFETLGMPPRADPSKPKATGPTKADVSHAALTAMIIRNSLATQRDSCGLLPATVAAVHGHAETTRRLLDWKPDLRDLEPVAWADRDAIDVATLAAASPDELIAAKASLRRVDWAAPLFDMPGPGERKAHLLLHVEAKAEASDDVVAALMRILPQHVLTLPGPSGETAIELALRDEELATNLVGLLLARGVQFETRAQAEMAERISAIPDAACAAVDRFRPAASRGGLTELHYLCRSGLGEPIARLCAAAPQRAALATRDGRMPAQLWQLPRATAGAAPAGDDEAGEDYSPADDDPPCEAAPSTEHAPAAGEPAPAPPATRPRPGASRLPPACLNPATALVAALEHACATNPDSMTTAFAEDAEQHARCLKGLEQLVASPRLAGFVEAARMDMEHAWDGRSAEQRDFLRRCLGPTFAGGHAIGSSEGRMARQQLWRELLHPTSRRLDETDGLPLTPMAAEALVRSEWRAQLQPPLADTALSAWAPEDGLAMELTPVAVEILSTAAKQANWTRDTMASMPPRLLSARKLTLLGAVDAAMLPGLARALPGVTHLRYHGATSDGILRLAEALADWRCVEVLELQGAKYDVAAMEAFGPALRELPRLRALRIGGNDPEDSSPTTKLIDCLGGLSSLQQLNLAGRRISNRGAKTLAAALGGMEQLRSLVLSGCAIAKRGIQDIAVALRGRRITTLVLSGNSITDGAAAEVIATVRGLPYLATLRLSGAGLCQESALGLMEAVGECGMLEELELNDNADLFAAPAAPGRGAAAAAAAGAGGDSPSATLLDAACSALARCPRLRVVRMTGAGLPSDAAKRIKALLPKDCETQF
ncbi:hypothetical protein FNF29_05743 [Cafeteria roenbergensis]|uniref:Guanylate-binding protein N-terminal domain-containing protein n=1 Tax=Cafeteria roenbergensis TaxID=33653 RepID=A0A5A8C9F2_CAFRO|nr:hypothetical protein FNF29_05743 [Cafeteria roenbergensis]|eukprot:KAA0149732.1 hypothetical protein FNF29_05743 [Cafeteria roenbergensis]